MKRYFPPFFILLMFLAGPVFAGENHPVQEKGLIQEQVKNLQQVMMNDDEIMNIILSLQSDPDFQKALEDPSLMEAIKSGDIEALRSNQKFINLLLKSSVRDINEKIIE